jgi:hypothetical protein
MRRVFAVWHAMASLEWALGTRLVAWAIMDGAFWIYPGAQVFAGLGSGGMPDATDGKDGRLFAVFKKGLINQHQFANTPTYGSKNVPPSPYSFYSGELSPLFLLPMNSLFRLEDWSGHRNSKFPDLRWQISFRKIK